MKKKFQKKAPFKVPSWDLSFEVSRSYVKIGAILLAKKCEEERKKKKTSLYSQNLKLQAIFSRYNSIYYILNILIVIYHIVLFHVDRLRNTLSRIVSATATVVAGGYIPAADALSTITSRFPYVIGLDEQRSIPIFHALGLKHGFFV